MKFFFNILAVIFHLFFCLMAQPLFYIYQPWQILLCWPLLNYPPFFAGYHRHPRRATRSGSEADSGGYDHQVQVTADSKQELTVDIPLKEIYRDPNPFLLTPWAVTQITHIEYITYHYIAASLYLIAPHYTYSEGPETFPTLQADTTSLYLVLDLIKV